MMRLVSAALVLISATPSLAADNRYAPEINALRQRSRDVVDVATPKLVALKRHEEAWARILRHTNAVASLVNAAFAPTSALRRTTEDLFGALPPIAVERVRTRTVLNELDFAKTRIDADLLEAQAIADEIPELAVGEADSRARIDKAITDLRTTLLQREKAADEALAEWTQWQAEALQKTQVSRGDAVRIDLKFRDRVQQVANALAAIRAQGQILIADERPVDLAELRDGLIWLRGALPQYFAGMISTGSAADTFADLDEAAAAIIEGLTPFAAPIESRAALRARNPDSDDETGDSDDAGDFQIPDDSPESNSCHEEHHEWKDGSTYKVKSEGDLSKSMMDYETETITSAQLELGSAGYFKNQGGHAEKPAPLPKGPELRDQVTHEFRDLTTGAAKPEELSTQGKRVNDLIGESRQEANRRGDHDDERELGELQAEAERFNRIHERIKDHASASAAKAKGAREGAVGKVEGCQGVVASANDPMPRPTQDASGYGFGGTAAVTRLAVEAALIASGADTPYDLGNFVVALVSDSDLWGQPAGLGDKALLGAAAVIPFISGAMIRGGETIVGLAKRSKLGGRIAKGDLLQFGVGEAELHFAKYRQKVMDALGRDTYDLPTYVRDANQVIKDGAYAKELNGFVLILGGERAAKVAFVGVSQEMDRITTFGIRYVDDIINKAPSLGWSK